MSNRRDFLKLISAACIAASAGLALTPEQRKLVVRHTHAYSMYDSWHEHRFEVRIDDNVYVVDARSEHEALTEREVGPMLLVLNNHVQALHGEEIQVTA